MQLVVMRHGQTQGNLDGLLLGCRTDLPLCEEGRAAAQAAGVHPQIERVFVSPLLRARQTASICFPRVEQVVIDDLREIDLGLFDGRTHDELLADDGLREAYKRWQDAHGAGRVPEGESRYQFITRTARALTRVLCDETLLDAERVVVVAHSGTVMAAMHAMCKEKRHYFQWRVGPCCGYKARVIGFNKDCQVRVDKAREFKDLSFLAEKASRG